MCWVAGGGGGGGRKEVIPLYMLSHINMYMYIPNGVGFFSCFGVKTVKDFDYSISVGNYTLHVYVWPASLE